MTDIEEAATRSRDREKELKGSDIWLLGRGELIQLIGILKWDVAKLERKLRDRNEQE